MSKSYRLSCLLLAALCICGALLAGCDSGSPSGTANPTATGGSASPTADDSAALATEAASLPTATGVATPEGLSVADASNIYAAVVDSLLGEKVPPVVYISPYVGQGDSLDQPDENSPLPDQLLAALPASSATKYQLSDFSQAIGPLDQGGQVNNNGAFVTLGAITPDPASPDQVIVRASLYRKTTDAVGDRFQLQRDQSASYGWSVISTTQEWTNSD